jgi:hypothetical protein
MGKSDALLYYLEASEKMRKARSGATPAAGGTALSVLTALAADPQGVMALTDLQKASGMGFLEFSEALKRLVGTGYLTVSGQPGSETAQLTKLGVEVADLARPA